MGFRELVYLALVGLVLIVLLVIGLSAASPIMQGQCVELNKTYDIAGIGWYNEKIVYYGQWYDAYTNDDNSTVEATLKIPSGISKLQNFYIDPVFFGNRLGYWYNSYEIYERGGNSRLFYVAGTCKPVNKTEPVPVTYNKSFDTNTSILPSKPSGVNILLARGDNLVIQNESIMRYWIFGNEYGNYDINKDKVRISATEFQNNAPGKYIIAVVYPGKNGIIEEYYNEKESVIESVFKNYPNEQVRGFAPMVVKDRLDQMVKRSYDDTIEYFTVSFDDPIIQVITQDQIDWANNKSYLDIRGYTNVINGTVIKAELESETQNLVRYPRISAESTVIEYGSIEWRQFKLLLPFNIDELPNGKHYVIISTPRSSRIILEPYIREELAEHYVPPGTIRFVDNSPFIPPPPPEIKIVEREVVKENVTIKTVVVKEEVDYVTLTERVIGTILAPAIVIICAGLLMVYGLYTAVRTRVKMKELKK